MDGYYMKYLKSSSCYTDLLNAEKKLTAIWENVAKLCDSLVNSSGNNVFLMQKDLVDVEVQTDKYIFMIQTTIKKLESNASMFDEKLNEWRSKIGSVIDVHYYDKYGRSVSAYHQESSLLETRSSYTYSKVTDKISNVEVDVSGYIKVTITETTETYTSITPGTVQRICLTGANIGTTTKEKVVIYDFNGDVVQS